MHQGSSQDAASRSWDRLDDQSEHTMAVLFLNIASIEGNESTTSDTFYSFPQPGDNNIIHSIRGALMTLYHHLPKLVSEKLER